MRCAYSSQPVACPICLDPLDDAAGALEMPCAKQHVFHRSCLLTWLQAYRNTCPICRHSMPTCDAAEEPPAAEGAEATEQTEAPADAAY